MTVYLASPDNQLQCEACRAMPVLLSFALATKKAYVVRDYQQTFARVLIDSGAYSEMNTGQVVDGEAYRDWAAGWDGHADAVAGLDDISGDWRRSVSNYERFGGFPTFHDTDPPELLDDLIPIARERGGWIGLGLMPPRHNKEGWVRDACDRVPDDLHVHGWALRAYTHVRRIDSVDSTNCWRDGMKYKKEMPFLTYGECLEIVVKRYQRWNRTIKPREESLFADLDEGAA